MEKQSIYPYVRLQVVALHGASLNRVQISKQLKVSRCCVQSAIKKYKQLGRLNDLKHNGHPKKLSGREIRHLQKVGQRGVSP